MAIILSSSYNAPIQYYTKFLLDGPIVIDENEHYIKQSFRNRCLIYAADGMMPLSIPVNYSSQQKTKMKDVCISYQTNWEHLHWNAIISAYGSTPFFEYYRDDYEALYKQRYEYLSDLNRELLHLSLKLLRIDTSKVSYSSEYQNPNPSCFDFRAVIHPKLEIESDPFYRDIEYFQIFASRHGFIPNLSILDLLFNMGNESVIVLLNSIATNRILKNEPNVKF